MKQVLTLHEYDVLVPSSSPGPLPGGAIGVPASTYAWLESQALQVSDGAAAPWVRRCRQGVQLTSYAGVIAAPDGVQLEVLPKIGKALDAGPDGARSLLVDMLCCLRRFKHLHPGSATLAAARMPLLEVFIAAFLRTVAAVAATGLRGNYSQREDDLAALRGRLLVAQQLRRNLVRADRFHTAHDEFTVDRPENRLIHTALRQVLRVAQLGDSQRLARELAFVFADVPPSLNPMQDFQRLQLDRNMGTYADALAWARMIIQSAPPTSVSGLQQAPSLLFPMAKLFEAYVAKHVGRQLPAPLTVRTQVRRHHLVHHEGERWFQLKPDLVVSHGGRDRMVLDTKWKLLDAKQNDGTNKYGLSQSDFYQLHTYGQSYLGGSGDVALIYPRTDTLAKPLPVFDFPASQGLRLWVLPFCLKERKLMLPEGQITPLDRAI
ncbi:5-methylcytosine-specific restriction enzyme subunit McrC [compost metagenome]